MVGLLRRICSDYQLTVTPFTYTTFKETVRAELAQLFSYEIELIQQRNQRASLLEVTVGKDPMSGQQRHDAIALASDEYEVNELERKTALRRSAARVAASACRRGAPP
jgi:hypothetical protein